MNKFVRLTKWAIIIVLAVVVLGPVLIHIMFKFSGPKWLAAEWTAGDLLQYYGMIVTAVIAIGGLYLTFQDNRRGIKEQSRLDKLPYFSMITLKYEVHNPLFGTTKDKEIDSIAENMLKPKKEAKEFYYREERLKAAFIEIEKGKALIKTKFSEDKKK